MPRAGLGGTSSSRFSPASGVSWRITAGRRPNWAHWMNSVSGRWLTKACSSGVFSCASSTTGSGSAVGWRNTFRRSTNSRL
jgi:hypothetical protein